MVDGEAREYDEFERLKLEEFEQVTEQNAKEMFVDAKNQIMTTLQKLKVREVTEVENLYLIVARLTQAASFVAAINKVERKKAEGKIISFDQALDGIGSDEVVSILFDEFKDHSQALHKINGIEEIYKPAKQSWAGLHAKMQLLAEATEAYHVMKVLKETLPAYKAHLEDNLSANGVNIPPPKEMPEETSSMVKEMLTRYQAVLSLEKIIQGKENLGPDDMKLVEEQIKKRLDNKANWSERLFLQKLTDVFSFFPEEKKAWQRMYQNRYREILNSNEQRYKAIKARGALSKSGSVCYTISNEDIETILSNIDTMSREDLRKNPSEIHGEYGIYDWGRIESCYKQMGFTDEQLECVPNSFLLKFGSIPHSITMFEPTYDVNTETVKGGPIYETYGVLPGASVTTPTEEEKFKDIDRFINKTLPQSLVLLFLEGLKKTHPAQYAELEEKIQSEYPEQYAQYQKFLERELENLQPFIERANRVPSTENSRQNFKELVCIQKTMKNQIKKCKHQIESLKNQGPAQGPLGLGELIQCHQNTFKTMASELEGQSKIVAENIQQPIDVRNWFKKFIDAIKKFFSGKQTSYGQEKQNFNSLKDRLQKMEERMKEPDKQASNRDSFRSKGLS